MSVFIYKVQVTTEREEGLHASRDEQSEKIIEALEQATESADISGIGARGDSAYSVAEADIREMDNREMRQLHAEYDEMVKVEEPTDYALRQDLRKAFQEIKRLSGLVEKQKTIIETLENRPENKPTKVYQRKSGDRDAPAQYLADGRYDLVTFQFGADRHDGSFDVVLVEDGVLEIRSNSMGEQLAVIPWSGNVIRLKVLSNNNVLPKTRR